MSTTTKGANWAKRWPTDKQIKKALEDLGSVTQVCDTYGISRSTMNKHLKGHRRQVPGQPVKIGRPRNDDVAAPSRKAANKHSVEVGKESATAEFTEQTLDPHKVPTDHELIKRANLDPEVWEVATRRTSVWESPGAEGEINTMRSLRVSFARRKDNPEDLILPAFGGRPVSVKPPTRRKANERDTELIVVVSDFHCPFFDEELLQAAEQMLLDCQPDRLILAGDLLDWPSVSKHAVTTKACLVSANECIQSGGEVLARLRAAIPADCRFQFVPGNHDRNLGEYLLQRAGEAYDVCVAGTDIPVWSLRNLLRFDELGIEQVGREDQWQHAMVQLTPHLVVRHGLSVRAGSAASVVSNFKNASYASVSGHTHRQGIAHLTVWSPDGKGGHTHKICLGAEVGGFFQMPSKPTDWPTYTKAHNMDWAPGFATIELQRDTRYSLDLATWQNGELLWRGQRY